MNKTTMLILGLIGIIVFFYLFTGNKIREGQESKDNSSEGETVGVGGVGNPDKIIREPEEDKPKEESTTFSSEPEKEVPKEQCDPPVVISGQKCPPQKVTTSKQYCYNSPRYGPPKDPNAGLITTCTNLVRSHVNKCSATAAGLMTRAFGPKLETNDKNHQHATDTKLLGWLNSVEDKLRKMVENKTITEKAVKLAPKFAPKFEYPKRRGLSHDEYNMWRNVLTKGDVSAGVGENTPGSANVSGAPSQKQQRDIKIYVTDNRVVKKGQQNNQGNGNGNGNGDQQNGGNSTGRQGGSEQDNEDNTGPLNGSFVGDGTELEAYNHDDYA